MTTTTPAPIAELLARLDEQLRPWGGRLRRRARDEARDHLLSAVEEQVALGIEPTYAARVVAARFGDPTALARELTSMRGPNRTSWTAQLADLGAGLAGAAFVGAAQWRVSTNPGTAIGHTFAVLTGLVVGALVLTFRATDRGWQVRAARYVSYALLALLPVSVHQVTAYGGQRFREQQLSTAADRAQWHAQRISDTWTGSIAMLVVIGGYAFGMLWVTSRRGGLSARALGRAGVLGAAAGLLAFALTPFGTFLGVGWLIPADFALPFVLCGAPVLAARWAALDPAPREPRTETRGWAAGLFVGLVGALVVVVLTLPMMAHFPTHVALEWANPDPNVPHGTDYELRMSVGDGAAKYLWVLFLGPLVAAGLGLLGTNPSAGEPAPSSQPPDGSPRSRPVTTSPADIGVVHSA